MLPIFKQIYNYIFARKEFDHKIGDVVFLFPSKKCSKKTKTILKIYGRSGFIVCEKDKWNIKTTKSSVKLLSRQHILKFDKQKKKMGRKFWLGWIPLEEISWEKREKRDL